MVHCTAVEQAQAYTRFKKWGTNHGERENEAPRGVGVGRRRPLPIGAGVCGGGYAPSSGEGAKPPPQKMFRFFSLKWFGAFCELILLHLNCLS